MTLDLKVEGSSPSTPIFTSKQAADITGCTLRQLQYWRDQGIVLRLPGRVRGGVFITLGVIWRLGCDRVLSVCGVEFSGGASEAATAEGEGTGVYKFGFAGAVYVWDSFIAIA